MEKNTGKFMKELWTLLLSAQNNASGVPQQFLDAKEEETRKKMVCFASYIFYLLVLIYRERLIYHIFSFFPSPLRRDVLIAGRGRSDYK